MLYIFRLPKNTQHKGRKSRNTTEGKIKESGKMQIKAEDVKVHYLIPTNAQNFPSFIKCCLRVCSPPASILPPSWARKSCREVVFYSWRLWAWPSSRVFCPGANSPCLHPRGKPDRAIQTARSRNEEVLSAPLALSLPRELDPAQDTSPGSQQLQSACFKSHVTPH